MWVEWIFSGIGTWIISVIVSFLLGDAAGYKIGINKASFKQNQKAGNNAVQNQNVEKVEINHVWH